MRKELYKDICASLSRLYKLADGSYIKLQEGDDVPEGAERLIKYIDLWNHNVEFIEQEEAWNRPAVFVEFTPIHWTAIHPGVEYRAEPVINLHVVTDWSGSVSAESELRDEGLEVFDLLDEIHESLSCSSGETYAELDLAESLTNHNHEDVLESIESYQCVAFKSLK